MFTGIVEALGRIESTATEKGNLVLEIYCPFEPKLGESVAVDGVCLTVKTVKPGRFLADAVAQTAALTTLKLRRAGDAVNLERALLPTDRLGGHFVSGHIDETGQVLNIRSLTGSWLFEFGVSEARIGLVAEKGSIATDGISLTIAATKGTRVLVSVIPFTFEHTTLKNRRIGDPVNVEFDLIAKHVMKLLDARR